jgi:hypothetical protein
LTGKWVGDMFENNRKDDDIECKNHFFTCKTTAEKLCKILKDFFAKNSKEVEYGEIEGGKFTVLLKYENIENISLTLKVFKITNEKSIVSLVFNEVRILF